METGLLSGEVNFDTLFNKLKDVLSGEIRDKIKRETQDFKLTVLHKRHSFPDHRRVKTSLGKVEIIYIFFLFNINF